MWSFERTKYTLVVSDVNYTLTGELTTDDANMAKTVMLALRDKGFNCGVLIEKAVITNSSVTTDEEWKD